MNDEEGDGVIFMSPLEEICFLYFKDGNLCMKKCNGHNKECRQYVKYVPKKEEYKPATKKEFMHYPSKEKK